MLSVCLFAFSFLWKVRPCLQYKFDCKVKSSSIFSVTLCMTTWAPPEPWTPLVSSGIVYINIEHL